MKIRTIALLFLVTSSLPVNSCVCETVTVIDSIVATVDDKPITLSDLGKRLSPPRTLSLGQAATDPGAKEVLNGIILERMLTAEAERRNIKVSDEDVNHYLDEIKRKNGIGDEGLATALQEQHKTLDEYKDQIKTDILRSKIASLYIKTAAAVTDEEIDSVLTQGSAGNPDGQAAGNKIHIRQIFLPTALYTADEARKLSETIREKVGDGAEFTDLAKEFSKGPEAAEGGDMGLINEKDLSPDIFDAVLPLKDGEVSILVSTAQGYFLYQVVERVSAKEAHEGEQTKDSDKPVVSDSLRAQIRQKLEQEKMQTKMLAFVESELPKMHTVDKRI